MAEKSTKRGEEMKAIEKYLADDGTEFKTAADCLAHEELCEEVALLVAKLKPTPKDDSCRFANGHGYVQQTAGTFLFVREVLLSIAQRYIKGDPNWLQQSIDDPTVHPSWAGRLISDGCPMPLWRAWNRIMCTDKQYREWGQPYYANNPSHAPVQTEVSCA